MFCSRPPRMPRPNIRGEEMRRAIQREKDAACLKKRSAKIVLSSVPPPKHAPFADSDKYSRLLTIVRNLCQAMVPDPDIRGLLPRTARGKARARLAEEQQPYV